MTWNLNELLIDWCRAALSSDVCSIDCLWISVLVVGDDGLRSLILGEGCGLMEGRGCWCGGLLPEPVRS